MRKSEVPSLITMTSEINLIAFQETDLTTAKQFLMWTTQAGVCLVMHSTAKYKDTVSLFHRLFNAGLQ
jgi:hypothetical protein